MRHARRISEECLDGRICGGAGLALGWVVVVQWNWMASWVVGDGILKMADEDEGEEMASV